MIPSRSSLILALAVLLTGCESGNPNSLMTSPAPRSARLAQPDATYRLSQADRAKVKEFFDAEALERLLQMVEPEFRKELLPWFQNTGERRGMVTSFPDPVLQAALNEVWVPWWDMYTLEELDKERSHIPGRDAARRRKIERQQRGNGPE